MNSNTHDSSQASEPDMKKRSLSYFTEESQVEYWDSVYDQKDFQSTQFQKRMNVALSWLDGLVLTKNAMILDAGCGTGRVAREVARRGYFAFGMDFSREMLVRAENIGKAQNEPSVNFMEADIETLPLKEASFDVVICLGVVSYLPSLGEAFCELRRILKPGGVLIISFVNKARAVGHLDPLVIGKRIRNRIWKVKIFGKNGMSKYGEGFSFSYFIPNIRAKVEDYGFKVLDDGTVPYESLTFLGKRIYPPWMSTGVALFFERFSNVPIFKSFGGLYMIKAKKESGTYV